VQRTSSDLRLNPHLHLVALDGAWHEEGGELYWQGLGHLQTSEVGAVLESTVRRIERHLGRCGLLGIDEDEAEPGGEGDPEGNLAASAVSGQTPPAGPQWVSRLAPLEPHALAYDKPLCASLDGFTLHAATRAGALHPAGREALLRYVLRPPVAQERVELRPDGLVRITLKKAYADGTIAVDMDPLSLLCRLATTGRRRRSWSRASAPSSPGVVVVSKEGDVDTALAAAGSTYWLVDPLDGTTEFLKGLPEYTVNVALVEAGGPHPGGHLRFGRGLSVPRRARGRCAPPGRAGRDAASGGTTPRASPGAVVSRSHLSPENGALLARRLQVSETIPRGSSLKMSAVAEGAADLYLRLGPTRLWDIAAGDRDCDRGRLRRGRAGRDAATLRPGQRPRPPGFRGLGPGRRPRSMHPHPRRPHPSFVNAP
jgi:inositol monophosphatase family protein/putative transposase